MAPEAAASPSRAAWHTTAREGPRLRLQRLARKNFRSRGAICSRNLRPLNVP